MFKKTNFAGYEKDESNNLVINKNKDEYTLYLQNREKAKEFRRLSNDVERLKKEVAEMKETIKIITNKIGNL